MRAPYELYIQAQITSGRSLDEINDYLYEIKLPPIPENLHTLLTSSLMDSKVPKAVKDHWTVKAPRQPKGYVSYMASLSLQEDAEKSPEYLSSVKLFENPVHRLALNCLTILNIPYSEIDVLIKKKYSLVITSETYRIYLKYFWDLKRLSRKDWPDFLRVLLEDEQEITYKAITGKQLECLQALELPLRVSVVEHYQKLHLIAMEKFAELTKMKGANTDVQALKWAQLAMAAGDKFEKLKSVDIMDFSKEIQLQFEHVDVDFPLIGESDE